MNILDENIEDDERIILRQQHARVRQIGFDIARKGLQDDQIIPFLCGLRYPTFFTRDLDFYRRNLCHARYCLVYLAIGPAEVADFVRRVLRHPNFNSEAKRIGTVIRAASPGLTVWRLYAETETNIAWPT